MSTPIYDNTESRAFKFIALIFSGLVLGVSIVNAVYYNRLRDDTTNVNSGVTPGEANVMFWINIIIAVISGIVFLWSIYRIVFSKETRQRVKYYALSPEYGATTGYTYTPSTAASKVSVAPAPRQEVRTDVTRAAMYVTPAEERSLQAITNPLGN